MVSYAAKMVSKWRHGRVAIDRLTFRTNPWGQAGSCVPLPLQISGIDLVRSPALLAQVLSVRLSRPALHESDRRPTRSSFVWRFFFESSRNDHRVARLND
jgi:hypothetical protein